MSNSATPLGVISKQSHVPALDGLRGVAIITVMVHHFMLWDHHEANCAMDRAVAYVTDTGWMGVEIFFVLSGFLITGILVQAKQKPFYFRNFYARRLLRIFPLYYLMLLLVFHLLPHLPGRPVEFASRGPYEWTYWLYLSNFTVLPEEPLIPVHRIITWSLAVEEQFYLVWPFLIWSLTSKTCIRLCVGLMIGTAVLRALWPATHLWPDGPYFLTPLHMDGLALGSLIALLMSVPTAMTWLRANAVRMGIAGLLGLLGTIAFSFARHVATRRDPVGQIVLYTFTALVSGAGLLLALERNGRTARLLANPVLRFLGKYSFSLYLFHLIVFLYLTHYAYFQVVHNGHTQIPRQLLLLAVAFPITIAWSMLTWNLLENPCLKLKRYFPEPGPIRE